MIREEVLEILALLSGRGGFDHWWDEIDPEIQDEIILELMEIGEHRP